MTQYLSTGQSSIHGGASVQDRLGSGEVRSSGIDTFHSGSAEHNGVSVRIDRRELP
jgi:hypothetical protein